MGYDLTHCDTIPSTKNVLILYHKFESCLHSSSYIQDIQQWGGRLFVWPSSVHGTYLVVWLWIIHRGHFWSLPSLCESMEILPAVLVTCFEAHIEKSLGCFLWGFYLPVTTRLHQNVLHLALIFSTEDLLIKDAMHHELYALPMMELEFSRVWHASFHCACWLR